MLPDPHPREVDLDIAGTEKTGLWNNQNVIKVKSKGTTFFFFFFFKKVLLCPFCTCMFSYAHKPGVQVGRALFVTAAGEIAPNEKQYTKQFISLFCKTESPKDTFAKHGVSFSTGLVETLKVGSATTINARSLKHLKTSSWFAVTHCKERRPMLEVLLKWHNLMLCA